MKPYEKALLNTLKKPFEQDEPLKEVKKSLGSLRNVVGNPLFKAEITLQITLQYFDLVAGALIAPGALPANVQTALPVYLFGLTDFYGGYSKASNLTPPNQGWQNIFLVPGNGIVEFTTAANALFVMNFGDMVRYYQDVALNRYIACVRVQCQNIVYGTFLNSFVSDLITINTLRLSVPPANINQLINPLNFGYQNLFGKLATDSIDPRMFQTPAEFQNQIADIPVNVPVDKNLLLTYYQNYDCIQKTIILYVEKVEPLTSRPTKINRRKK